MPKDEWTDMDQTIQDLIELKDMWKALARRHEHKRRKTERELDRLKAELAELMLERLSESYGV